MSAAGTSYGYGPPPFVTPDEELYAGAGDRRQPPSAQTTGTTEGSGSAVAVGPQAAGATPLAASYAPSYDPNAAVPYAAPTLPQTVQPIENPGLQQPEPTQRELGAARGVGAAAYMGNQLLKGWMQGKAVRDMRNAVALHQQSTGLQSIWKSASDQAVSLAQSGQVSDDPNSPYQKALAASNAAHQALMDFYGQHVQPAGKGKNGQLSVMQKLQQAFQGQDPAAISSAVYEGLQKTGDPTNHLVAAYTNPAYQQRVQQAAQTRGATAEAAQGTAENQAELQRLLSLPNPTQADQDRIMQLKYGIAKSTTLPPAMTWKNAPTSQSFKGVDGQWYHPQINGVGQYRMESLGPNYQPTAAEQKETPGFTFNKDGIWYTYSLGRDGKPDAKTVKPLSASVAAGPTSTTSVVTKMVQQPDGSTVPVQVENHSTRTHGGGGAGAGAGAGSPFEGGATAAGAPPAAMPPVPAATTAVVPSSQPGMVSVQSNQPAADGSMQTTTTTAPASAMPSTHHAAAAAAGTPHVGTGGGGVIGVGQPVGGKVPTQELQAYHAMQDTAPVVSNVMKMLEPFKNDDGVLDEAGQRFKGLAYKAGFRNSPLDAALQQYANFVKIAGASPWAKVGRGVTILQQIQEHLPDPSKDTPALMYQKLSDIQNLYQQQMGEMQGRMQAMTSGGARQQQQPSAALPPAYRSTLPATPPTGGPVPSTHVFNATKWAAANPGKDVNAAKQQAKTQGFAVMENGKLVP